MKIEKEILQFQIGFQTARLGLSALQTQYLSVLSSQASIESTVQYFLSQGWLVSFSELYTLVEKLVYNKAILNPGLQDYFKSSNTRNDIDALKNSAITKWRDPSNIKSLMELPFFRSLDPKLSEFLLSRAHQVKLPAKNYICNAGDTTRDMYILLNGQAGVYRPTTSGQHQLVATLSDGSIFGEAGFFLGAARSASIVTTKESDLLVIPYMPEVFDRHIDRNKAQGLQLRFWVQHALQNSEFFKSIPSDCLDALGFSGNVVRVAAHQSLFRQGDPGQTAYIVVQGSLVASQNGKNIRVLNQGAFFGEISLLVSGGNRTAHVQSQQETLLLEIHQNDFYRLLSQNLFLAKEIENLAHERLRNDQMRMAR